VNTSDVLQAQIGSVGGGLKLALQVNEELVGHLTQDLGEGVLDERVGMQLNHGVLAEVVDDLVEVALVVVDDGPAASPARNAVDLGKGTSAHHGNGAGHVTH